VHLVGFIIRIFPFHCSLFNISDPRYRVMEVLAVLRLYESWL